MTLYGILTDMKIGEMLEQARVERGMTAAQAAAALRIQQKHWYRIVNGESYNLTMRVAARAKTELGVSLEQLAASDEITALSAS